MDQIDWDSLKWFVILLIVALLFIK